MSSLTHAIGGVFQPLLKVVADLLAWLYSFIPIYPIDVALLTIIIMAVLTPLTVKSTKNMAAMQALGPEMKKLQQKYKGPENRAILNEEMMKLYKEHQVNPASGCLPMLLQMPAFLVLYDVIRGITNTVNKGAPLPNGHSCVPLPGASVCAAPRYISSSTKMYHDIVAASGQLNSFGMNFANKLLSHHSPLWAGIPYLVLVLGSVGLQYLQMSRLNARNPKAAEANPQAAMLQKYMPLIFGLIYLNVAALLNVYFVFSSAIRIGTQEVLFRKGIVAGPPPPPAKKPIPTKGPSGSKSSPGGKPTGGTTKAPAVKADRTAREIPKARPPIGSKASTTKAGAQSSATSKSSTVRARDLNAARRKPATSNGATSNGATSNGDDPKSSEAVMGDQQNESSSKEHPRSKAKRERKAR
jgi:YidC/Oxa1 family membrane protein insertase